MSLFSSEERIILKKNIITTIVIVVLLLLGALIYLVMFAIKMAPPPKNVKTQILEISKMLDIYALDCGHYPTTDEGLKALQTKPASCEKWGPERYLISIPKDQWGHEFIYISNGPSDFELKSLGSDAREGGIGEAKDISSKEIIH
jgi:general secretion pathway protein G